MATEEERVVCAKCEKEKIESDRASTRTGAYQGPCGEFYAQVERCMAKEKGQIRACVAEWDAFRRCREEGAGRT